MATTAEQPAEKEGTGKSKFIFPSHLAQLIDQDLGHPHLILINNEDSDEIFLPVPESITLADGANYEGLDRADFKTAESFGTGNELSKADSLALGLRATKNLPGLDKISKETFMNERMASNPMTEMAFSGMSMRSINLSFEMMPRNEKEAVSIRDIESKLRALMYPNKTGATGYTVRFPAMFTIMFMAGEQESRFFPIFHHAYLSALSTDFRAQNGAYFKVKDDFMGQKHKMDLTFTESKMLTRNDILDLDARAPKRGEMEKNTGISTTSDDVVSANTPAKTPKGGN